MGSILDVAVDIRKNSPTYGKVFSIELSAENKKQLYIPKGFAHGFSVLSETAEVLYKCDNFYNKQSEGGILLNDADLNIDWQIPADKMIVSDKDKQNSRFADIRVTLNLKSINQKHEYIKEYLLPVPMVSWVNHFKSVSNEYPSFKFLFTARDTLSIDDEAAVAAAFADFKPDYVINAAAYTAVDKAESDNEGANAVNGTAVGILAGASKKARCKIYSCFY